MSFENSHIRLETPDWVVREMRLVEAIDPTSHEAQSIHVASEALLERARAVETIEEGLSLYHITKGLRERLDAVCAVALTRANQISVTQE